MSSPENLNPQFLAHDLRQIYARIVGEHMILVAEARNSVNFYNWFNTLENLHTISKHNFKQPTEADKKYKDLREAITKLANKNAGSWLGTTIDKEKVAEITVALRNIEEFIYSEMKKGKMFGDSGRIPGL